MFCGKRHGTTASPIETASYEECIEKCGSIISCTSVDYSPHIKKCYLGKHSGVPQIDAPGFNSACSMGCAGACDCEPKSPPQEPEPEPLCPGIHDQIWVVDCQNYKSECTYVHCPTPYSILRTQRRLKIVSKPARTISVATSLGCHFPIKSVEELLVASLDVRPINMELTRTWSGCIPLPGSYKGVQRRIWFGLYQTRTGKGETEQLGQTFLVSQLEIPYFALEKCQNALNTILGSSNLYRFRICVRWLYLDLSDYHKGLWVVERRDSQSSSVILPPLDSSYIRWDIEIMGPKRKSIHAWDRDVAPECHILEVPSWPHVALVVALKEL